MAPKKVESAEAKKKLDSFIQQVTVLNNTLTFDVLREFDEAAVEVRIEQVDRLEKRFDALYAQLENNDADDILAEFTNHYIEVKTKLTRQRHACQASEAHSSTTRPFAGDQTSIIVSQPKQRLPVLQIPTFNGKYSDWPDFFSMFNTLVHQDVDLTRIEKFQHLRSSLRDAALDTIRSLEISEQNYDKAIDLLRARFDNKRLNFQAHIRDIFQLKRVEGDRVAKLRELSDTVNAHLRALQTMGTKEQIADCLLIQLVSQNLDVKSRAKWEEQTPVSEIPTWNSMARFLEHRCQQLENVENVLGLPEKQVGKKLSNQISRKVLLTAAVAGCILCSSSEHRIARCKQFLSLSPTMRYKEAKRLNLCLNCLRVKAVGHSLKDCKSGHCRHCTSKHHSLLHQDTNSFPTTSQPMASDKPPQLSQPTTSSSFNPYSYSSSSFGPSASALVASEVQASVADREFVLLATAIIYVKNRSGSLIPCRALLDSASQLNFITNRLANQLQLKKIKSSQFISGIGQNDFVDNHIVNFDLHSRINDYIAKLSAVITPTITDVQPSRSLKGINWNIPQNIRLADPHFFEPQRVDMLIGASLFFDLLCVGQIRLAENLPLLQKTKLGWVVSGATTYNISKLSCLAAIDTALANDTDDDLYNLVQRFWEIENCIDSTPKTTIEED
ncbi:uncharacterized protein LOC125777819 [Bactrocera dorsalis]|uniref:Uncharacterized protein LOC125777819 n=1 Tax=Bactrocera dorsalis TaxID=27457 RepID=A0ABM3JK15_BACDO|nr:uncharacterized protein LOC125777819 [Bactrocera dorsalis]